MCVFLKKWPLSSLVLVASSLAVWAVPDDRMLEEGVGGAVGKDVRDTTRLHGSLYAATYAVEPQYTPQFISPSDG